MIHRDELNLPFKYRRDGTRDITDSAFMTGMLALFGSEEDKSQLDSYIFAGELLRHLYINNEPKKYDTSRDQLIAWSAKKTLNTKVNDLRYKYARKFFINSDYLLPHIKLFLYRQSGHEAPIYLVPFAYAFLVLHLLTAIVPSYFQSVRNQHEINQNLCLFSSYGKFWIRLFLWLHKSPDENMRDYWETRRDMGEVYEMYTKWRYDVNGIN